MGLQAVVSAGRVGLGADAQERREKEEAELCTVP